MSKVDQLKKTKAAKEAILTLRQRETMVNVERQDINAILDVLDGIALALLDVVDE